MKATKGGTAPDGPGAHDGLELLDAHARGAMTPAERARLAELAQRSEEWRDAAAAFAPLEPDERNAMITGALAVIDGRVSSPAGDSFWVRIKKKLNFPVVGGLSLAAATSLVLLAIYPQQLPVYARVEPNGFGKLCRALGPKAAAPESECRTWGLLPEQVSFLDPDVEVVVYEAGGSEPVARSLEPQSGAIEILKPVGYQEAKALIFVIARPAEMPATLEEARARCTGAGAGCQLLELQP